MSSRHIFDENICVICHGGSTDIDICEVSRGLDRLIEYSVKLQEIDLQNYLLTNPKIVKVHNKCRKAFTSKRKFDQKRSLEEDCNEDEVKVKLLRSRIPPFEWKLHCFFCGSLCDKEIINQKDNRSVTTLEMKDNVLDQCANRSDEWGLQVKSRLLTCNDLVAEEAIYHKNCFTNFFRKNKFAMSGRPCDNKKKETFNVLCEWLEVNDAELLTLQDIVNKAKSLVPENNDVYSEKWLKEKLKSRYGEHIQFCEVLGKRNVVCWKEMADYIVNEKWHNDRKEDEADHIVVTAAKLLRTVIREQTFSMDSYPTCDEVRNMDCARKCLPNLLLLFLDNLIFPESKKLALGQCILQAVKPRTVIAPIPFAVGITIDHICASKFIIDLLFQLGMSVSYDEIYRFKQSVTRCVSTDDPSSFQSCFTQYAADNVDHNVCTLDGTGTIHAMGIISITNSCLDISQGYFKDCPITRLQLIKSADVVKTKKIPILPCKIPDMSFGDIYYKNKFSFVAPLPQSI